MHLCTCERHREGVQAELYLYMMNIATYFRIVRWVTEEENKVKENGKGSVEAVILDMSSKFCNISKHQLGINSVSMISS